MRTMPSDKIQKGGGGGGWGWQIQIQEESHTFILKVGEENYLGAGGTPRLTAYIHVYTEM